jgi:chorismate mutase
MLHGCGPAAARRLAVIAGWTVMMVVAGSMPSESQAADGAAGRLREAMIERLGAMPDVARHKWNSHAAVEDPPREKLVVDAAIAEGQELGLAPRAVRTAVEAQIEAAKIIQAGLIARWSAEQASPFAGVPDLATVLRPRIQQATSGIVAGLAGSIDELGSCEAVRDLRDLPAALQAYPAAWAVAVEGVIAAAVDGAPPTCVPGG